MQTKEYSLKATATATEDGFEILAIDEGEAKGHGIRFTSAVLQTAVPLYEGKPVFIDHAGLYESPSVRNLAGTLHGATFDEQKRGVRAVLKPAGPAADVLTSVRMAAKDNPAIMEAVGFSTVLRVQLERDGNVKKIVSVKSVDVVIDPARGGKFLQEINSGRAPAEDRRASRVSNQKRQGGLEMPSKKKFKAEIVNAEGETEEVLLEAVNDEADPIQAQLDANAKAAATLLGETQRMQEMDAQLAQSQKTLVAMCEHLLATGLSNSRLPAPSQESIRKQFAGKVFQAHELSTAIEEKRKELAAVLDSQNIAGPARITGMVDSKDQFKLAIEDLFGVERDEKEKNIKIHRLSGIREAYLMATGDRDFMGGYHPQFALVSANFPGIVANVMNKILVQAWEDYRDVYGWWEKIVTVEHFTNLNDVSWVRTGTIASLPSISERGEYTELPIGDNKETSSWEKFGGYVPLTIEAVLRDDLRAFKHMPREAALAGIRNISEQVAEIFTVNSGAGPTLADGGALFNATAVTTQGGHANLLTTALGSDYTAWKAVAKAMFDQPLLVKNASGQYGAGKKQAIEPKYALVPRALADAAWSLFGPRWANVVDTIPSVGGPKYMGQVEPLVVPEWTDDTDFAAVADPKLAPSIMLGEIFGVKPQIFSASSEIDPAMFANDESRIKVRQFLTVGVADFRPLHKSNVAG